MTKKKFIIIFLIIFLGFVLAIGFIIYIFLNAFSGSEDSRNTATVNIEQLSWPQGPYTIYYQDNNGLYSIRTDATKKTLLYSSEQHFRYMLLDNTKQILIKNNHKIIIFDDQGKNEKVVYTAPNGKSINQWNISPDEQKLVIQLADNREWENREKRIADDFVVINLDNIFIHYINSSEVENSRLDGDIHWSIDSGKVYFTLVKFDNPNSGHQLYYSYTLESDKISKIGEEVYSFKPPMKGLSYFIGLVVSSPSVKTRDYSTGQEYYTELSPDGKKSITTGAIVKVNQEDIFFWLYKGPKGPGTCISSGWLADNNHFIIECGNNLRVVEVDTKKTSTLAEGRDAKRFGQIYKTYFNPK